ncbi:MAG: NAD(P)H-hydrate epimerase [Clostridia bacterium]
MAGIRYRGMDVPCVSAAEMTEVDRVMTDDYGIGLPLMMENAGAALASLARRMREAQRERTGPILILAGRGGNGGGGLVAARRLSGSGWPIRVILAAEDLAETTRMQRGVLNRMGVAVTTATPTGLSHILEQAQRASLVIDALVGYGLRGPLVGLTAELAALASRAGTPVLALDVPSGLDPTAGFPTGPVVRATATLTLALPKAGLITPEARPFVGRLYLADIGVPGAVYDRIGLTVGDIFRGHRVIPLRRQAAG